MKLFLTTFFTLLTTTAVHATLPFNYEEEARFSSLEARALSLEAAQLSATSIAFTTNSETISNATDDLIEFLSNDEHTSVQVTGFEAKDAILNLYSDQGDDAADKYSIRASAADVLEIRNNGTAFWSFSSGGNVTATGSITGDGGDALSGFLKKQVAATATTITAAQCGSTFTNTGAVAIALPEASTVLGCRLTFITTNAANFDVNPDDADQILVLTNAAGDAIRNATLGNSVVIEAVSASQWAPVGKEQGSYTDID